MIDLYYISKTVIFSHFFLCCCPSKLTGDVFILRLDSVRKQEKLSSTIFATWLKII